jgi:Tol biopolymer transport system component
MKKTLIVSILLLAGSVAGCTYFQQNLESPGSRCAQGPFSFGPPTNLGPVVNSRYDEGSPHVSADGLALYFDSLRPGGLGGWDLWVTRRETLDSPWGPPEPLGPPVNSPAGESGPCLSADGLSLYFASNRPGGNGNFDIWVATRETPDDPWNEPVNLGSLVNGPTYDNHPSIAADGLSLYFDCHKFSLSRRRTDLDIYVTRRASLADDWGIRQNLGKAVNTPRIEYSPHVLPDGLMLFFDSRTTDRDLWVTSRENIDNEWAKATMLKPPVNTPYIDTDPTLSVNTCTFYFVSTRPGGCGNFDIWQAPVASGDHEED